MKYLDYVLQTLLDTIQIIFWIAVALALVCAAAYILVWNPVAGTVILLLLMILTVSYGRMLNDRNKNKEKR